jgi:hypothetical protein
MEEIIKKDIYENKKDVLDGLEFVKYVINHIEDYIKNKVHESGEVIEKGVNGVIDYIYIMLKNLINNQVISYGVILEDAKKKGLEKEFRVAYSILKSAKFIEYDANNKFIIMGVRLKNLINQYNNFEYNQKEKNIIKDNKKEIVSQNKVNYVNVSKANEIYYWILDEINKNEWVSIDVIKEMFKGHEKEIMETINMIVSEGKGVLIDNKIYKK